MGRALASGQAGRAHPPQQRSLPASQGARHAWAFLDRAVNARIQDDMPEGELFVDYVRYELMKRQWAQAHPGATPAEYEAMCREFAALCGV